jgi:hypothetical protein
VTRSLTPPTDTKVSSLQQQSSTGQLQQTESRLRQYLRLIDRTLRVWFHALEEEVSMTPATATQRRSEQTTDNTAIRPFQVNVPEAELTELRLRINATRLPEKETVADFSQGVPLDTVQKLARYWATEPACLGQRAHG